MIYKNIISFLKKRTIELIGLSIISGSLLLAISFFSYSPSDPTFVHGTGDNNINNLLGIYGGLVADFLLQSFGLAAFLIIITFTTWGISLIFQKEIKKILLKFFYLVMYLIFTCIFIYATSNNSFWLIDNGNSGFVGQILYNKILIILPNLNNEYLIFILITLSLTFFFLASNINIKHFFLIISKTFQVFKKNKINNPTSISTEQDENTLNYQVNNIPQQSFSFEKIKNSTEIGARYINYNNFKLPSVDLLEKNLSK